MTALQQIQARAKATLRAGGGSPRQFARLHRQLKIIARRNGESVVQSAARLDDSIKDL